MGDGWDGVRMSGAETEPEPGRAAREPEAPEPSPTLRAAGA